MQRLYVTVAGKVTGHRKWSPRCGPTSRYTTLHRVIPIPLTRGAAGVCRFVSRRPDQVITAIRVLTAEIAS